MLNSDGVSGGTCFQVAPGILVTAFHVLAQLDHGEPGNVVEVDTLEPGAQAAELARVIATDPVRDLAVLHRLGPLPGVVEGFALSFAEPLGTPCHVVGDVRVPDSVDYGYLTATGTWTGSTRRNHVSMGQFRSPDVLPGMSGAPLLRNSDGAVIGVASHRYQSSAELRGMAWMACTEHVIELLGRLPGVAVEPQFVLRDGEATVLHVVTALRALPGTDQAAGSSPAWVKEAAREAASILIALHRARRPDALMGLIDRLAAETALPGERGDAGRQEFLARIRVCGLDPRALLPGLPSHQEALNEWTSPLGDRGHETWDAAAMIADFTGVLLRHLDGTLFARTSRMCRERLKGALTADGSLATSRFLLELAAHLPRRPGPPEIYRPPVRARRSLGQGEEDTGRREAPSPYQQVISSTARRMCVVPPADPPFTGRDGLVSEVAGAIREAMTARGSVIAFLSGQPRVGTSEVAREVTRSLTASFPGGAYYVDLHGLSPEPKRRTPRTVVRILTEALGLDVGGDALDEAEALDRFFDQLAGRGVLLLLDNARNAEHVALLARRAPSCALVITCRDGFQNYSDPGLAFRVPQLERPFSIELLTAHCRQEPPGNADLDAIAALCGDVPLALRMIGARLATPDVTPREMRKALERETKRLAFMEPKGATRLDLMDPGELGIRAAIRLSYDLLEERARRSLRLIPAFPGEVVDADSLGHCTEYDLFEQELILLRLADHNLAAHRHDRSPAGFSLLELIRVFAAERLAEEEDRDQLKGFRSRALRYLLDRLIEINDQSVEAEVSGELDPAVFHEAERLAEELDQLDVATAFATNLWTLYSSRRELDGIVAVNAVRVDLYLRRGDPAGAARAALGNAAGLRHLKAWQHAETACYETLRIAHEHDLPTFRAKALFELNVLRGRLERWEESLDPGDRAADLFLDLGRDGDAASALLNNARFAARMGDHGKSAEWAERAAKVADRIGDRDKRAHAAFQMSAAYSQLEDFGNASRASLLAERLSEELRYWWNASIGAQDAANVALAQGDTGTAEAALTRAAAHLEHGPELLARRVQVLIELSAVQVQRDELTHAAETLTRAVNDGDDTVPPLLRWEAAVRATILHAYLREDPPITATSHDAGQDSDPFLAEMLDELESWRSGESTDTHAWSRFAELLTAHARHHAKNPDFWFYTELGEDPEPRGRQLDLRSPHPGPIDAG
ncbi:trypsin-like peptidase domain-containing protein [Sphaerisporangium aureirubrum]|uniref:Trypsin-like peptidase domain-containing protein n=1 Tax=Sphaerisporangium aureirubrum TaxID=1544736 RepID=A0ABW1NGL7_9ACTN